MKPMLETLVCFSHLRWNFVYQRPQHIMTRLSKTLNVTYIEEPIFDAVDDAYYTKNKINPSLVVLTPHLKSGQTRAEETWQQHLLLRALLKGRHEENLIFWYYTPMALEFSSTFKAGLTVYDCMDELSAFKFAPAKLKELEGELMTRADVVFTGGHTLYQEKKRLHSAIYPFPSSIDKRHFGKARTIHQMPADQSTIRGTKLGFFGVIDERFDIQLIRQIAEKKPAWQIILIGPVVKIDPADLPSAPNIHYLGQKTYEELPSYLAGWDIAMIPFMLNESTRFISPTKTPEYLAAGIPVISTPIRDVVDPYGRKRLVRISSDASQFIQEAEEELNSPDKKVWLKKVDAFLADMSWDNTTEEMFCLMKNKWNEKFNALLAS